MRSRPFKDRDAELKLIGAAVGIKSSARPVCHMHIMMNVNLAIRLYEPGPSARWVDSKSRAERLPGRHRPLHSTASELFHGAAEVAFRVIGMELR